jgi:hypothetical protein
MSMTHLYSQFGDIQDSIALGPKDIEVSCSIGVDDWNRQVRSPSTANIAFAQSPPGIGRKRPSLPGQLPGDRASAVPLQLPQMRPVGWEEEEKEEEERRKSC